MPWPKGMPQPPESKAKNSATHIAKGSNVTHGHASGGKRSPTWRAWRSMIQRCTYPSQQAYPRYGGRGIVVCDRWRHSFEAFLADMGEKPAGTTLGRMDNDGNYEPGNCRWETDEQQRANRSEWGTHVHNERKPAAPRGTCPEGCTCGRHRRRPCPEGCSCVKHDPKTLTPEHRARIAASVAAAHARARGGQ